jgi:TusA-related sulfurtransferase
VLHGLPSKLREVILAQPLMIDERIYVLMDTIADPDCILDLGEKGCSHLLEDITDAMKNMTPGQTLLVIAHDPAAPLDIKVWSRQTNNPLLRVNLSNDQFLLQKKLA